MAHSPQRAAAFLPDAHPRDLPGSIRGACWTRIRRLGYVSRPVSRSESSDCPRTCACFPAHAFLFSCVALAMADQSAPDHVGPTSPLFGFFSSDIVSDIPHGSTGVPHRASYRIVSINALGLCLHITTLEHYPQTAHTSARHKCRNTPRFTHSAARGCHRSRPQ